jgi:L-iditol 2-dehydrogenase
MANLFGGCPSGTKITIDTKLLHYSQITIKGIFHHTPQYVKRALNLISQGRIDADSLITDEFSLSNFPRVLDMLVNQEGIKIAVIP